MITVKMPQTTGETTLAATSNIQWDSSSFGLSLMSFRTSGETERGTMRLAAMKDTLFLGLSGFVDCSKQSADPFLF